MSHYHHWFAQWKSLFDGVELLPQDSCRVWIGVTAGIGVPVHVHVLRGKGIVHRDDATRTFELRRRGNAVKDVWRTEERTGLLRGEGSLRNERRADPILLHVVLHVGAFEIELIGRNQV